MLGFWHRTCRGVSEKSTPTKYSQHYFLFTIFAAYACHRSSVGQPRLARPVRATGPNRYGHVARPFNCRYSMVANSGLGRRQYQTQLGPIRRRLALSEHWITATCTCLQHTLDVREKAPAGRLISIVIRTTRAGQSMIGANLEL